MLNEDGGHVLETTCLGVNYPVNAVFAFAFEIEISLPIVIYWLNQKSIYVGY